MPYDPRACRGEVLAVRNSPGRASLLRYDVVIHFPNGDIQFDDRPSDFPEPPDDGYDVYGWPPGKRFLVDWDGDSAVLMIPWLAVTTTCEDIP